MSRVSVSPFMVATVVNDFSEENPPLRITSARMNENNANAIMIIRKTPLFLMLFNIAICHF